MPVCRVCHAEYEAFHSFGPMPLANGFLTPVQITHEYVFELKVGFCEQCGMVQLVDQPDREKMFHEKYAFYSSTSQHMQRHFGKFARSVCDAYLTDGDPFVVELGSNDGIMLSNFSDWGIRHLGVEPSSNVADVARARGIRTVTEFFDESLAERIVETDGPAHAILAANVMCHIPYLHSVAAGIRRLLAPKGVLVFEDPYLGDIVEKTSYDQIYDEHAFYFSINSVSRLFAAHGLEVIDVCPQTVHGGSMRYTIAHKGAHPVAAAVIYQRAKEEALGLIDASTFRQLSANIERSRDELMRLLTSLKQQRKRVVGYGATSKSTTVTQYCGITPELVEFISDTTPIKQGKLSPGAHIPVRAYDEFSRNYPDYALLFAWNHAAEIMEKEQAFAQAGGQWITYVPRVQVFKQPARQAA